MNTRQSIDLGRGRLTLLWQLHSGFPVQSCKSTISTLSFRATGATHLVVLSTFLFAHEQRVGDWCVADTGSCVLCLPSSAFVLLPSHVPKSTSSFAWECCRLYRTRKTTRSQCKSTVLTVGCAVRYPVIVAQRLLV